MAGGCEGGNGIILPKLSTVVYINKQAVLTQGNRAIPQLFVAV